MCTKFICCFSDGPSSDLGLDEDLDKPMTWLSCLLYVIANITGLFLFWLYQQARYVCVCVSVSVCVFTIGYVCVCVCL